MHQDNQGQCSRRNRLLVKLNLAAHAVAIVSCIAGAVILGSVVLMGSASHHIASFGIGLLIKGKTRTQPPIPNDAVFSTWQIILSILCIVLAISVSALGAHYVFHARTFDRASIVFFTVPGAVAALTNVMIVRMPDLTGGGFKTDAVLATLPTLLALSVSVAEISKEAGRVDAFAGLVVVLLLCARVPFVWSKRCIRLF